MENKVLVINVYSLPKIVNAQLDSLFTHLTFCKEPLSDDIKEAIKGTRLIFMMLI